jgi:two-component system LytT family response regulator
VPDPISINRIIAEAGGRMVLVDVDKIFFAFVKRDMVYIKTFDEEMLTRFTLKELEAKLGSNFFRSHRSYIVNIQKVREIHPFFNGTSILVMEDRERSEIPVSRNQSKKLRRLLGK